MGPTLAAIIFTKVGAQGQANEPEKEQATRCLQARAGGTTAQGQTSFLYPILLISSYHLDLVPTSLS